MLFQKIKSEGLQRARVDLGLYVDWDLDREGEETFQGTGTTVPEGSSGEIRQNRR